jgi:phospholipid/cholesterol/gamma-HCH transport system substrate-binding protein
MTEQGMRLRIGIFVLISLVLLVTLVVLFGSFPALLKRQDHYVATFPDAPHIVPGTPVRRCGVHIGEVERVELDDDNGGVRIHLQIDKPHVVRRNERPKLTQGLIGSDASIEFVTVPAKGAQPPDRSPVPPGETLEGLPQANVSSLLSGAAAVVPATQGAIDDARHVIRRVEQVVPLVEETVREYRDLARATREMVPELRRTNDDLHQLVKAVHEAVPNLTRTSDDVRVLVRSVNEAVPGLGKTSDEVRELAKAVRETMPELRHTNTAIQETVQSWGKVGERIDGLVQTNQERINQVCTGLQNSLARLGQVFNDDNLRNLTAVLKNVRGGTDVLQSLTHNTDEMMKESRTAIHQISTSLAKADETMDNMQQATKPFADRSDRIMKNLDESTEKLNKTMTELRDLMRLASQEDGTLRRLIVDPSLYNHLDQAAFLVVKLMPQVAQILCDFGLFADKIARHPEALGLGGVVRPDSGIKR